MKVLTIIFALLTIAPKQGETHLTNQESAEWLLGEWEGSGQLFGKEASFKMQWNSALNDQFMHLDFKNEHDSPEGVKRILRGEAFYKINASKVEGYWFDSRGMTLPLKGDVKDEVLTILWGDESTEQGRTIYKKTAAGIAVEDYYMKDGTYHLFGTSDYIRTTKP